jgi:hypothetical protein
MDQQLKDLYNQIITDRYQMYDRYKNEEITKKEYNIYTYIYGKLISVLEEAFELIEE